MIITLCGPTGAGKTTVARIISERCPNTQVISTGDIVRSMLIEKGWALNAENLQKTNQLLVEEKGDDYISIILPYINSNAEIVVIDSARRAVDLGYLRATYPKVVTLAVDCEGETRYQRLVKRGRVADLTNRESFNKISELEDVWGVPSLTQKADYNIKNNKEFAALEDIVVATMKAITPPG